MHMSSRARSVLLIVCLISFGCASEGRMPGSSGAAAAAASSLTAAAPAPSDQMMAGMDQARNLPADGKIAFIIGQESSTLGEFMDSVLDNPEHADFPVPAGITLYTALLPADMHPNTAPDDAALYVSGIEGPPADQSAGNVNFQETLSAYDKKNGGKPVAINVGLYLSDGWDKCQNRPLRAIIDHGDADVGKASDPESMSYQMRYGIDRMIKWFAQQDRPVFLRIGYEFDGPWNCYKQDYYKAAFRYIKERINALGANKVATVWHAATFPDDNDPANHYQLTGGGGIQDLAQAIQTHYSGWYPGSEYVDWVGISFFSGARYLEYQWSCPDNSKPWTVADLSPRQLQDGMADFARRRDKPLMIAESGPQGMNFAEETWSCVSQRQDHLPGHKLDGSGIWNAFFEDYFAWIEKNRHVVRIFSYINTNWQSQSRWACAPKSTACREGYWGDHRIQANAEVLARFKSKVQSEPYQVSGFSVGTATDTLPP